MTSEDESDSLSWRNSGIRRRELLRIAGFGASVTAVTGQSAASSATPRRETIGTTARPSIHTEITVTQTDTTGVAEINVTWDLDESINSFEQSYGTSAYTFTNTRYLDTSTSGELIWDERYGGSPTATFRYEVSQDRGSDQKQYYAVTDDWGLVTPGFRYGFGYKYDSGASLEPSTRNISVEGAGTAGNNFAYLGEYDEFETSVNGESIRLVVADHVTVDGPALLTRVSRAAERLAISGSVTERSDTPSRGHASNNPEVTVFIASDPIDISFARNSDCVILKTGQKSL